MNNRNKVRETNVYNSEVFKGGLYKLLTEYSKSVTSEGNLSSKKEKEIDFYLNSIEKVMETIPVAKEEEHC